MYVWCSCFHLAYFVPGRPDPLNQWVTRNVFIDSIKAYHNVANGFGGDGKLCGACCTQIMPGYELAVGCFGEGACNAMYCDSECRKSVAFEHGMLCKVRAPSASGQPWFHGSCGRLAIFHSLGVLRGVVRGARRLCDCAGRPVEISGFTARVGERDIGPLR
jgi:hypothetical protein